MTPNAIALLSSLQTPLCPPTAARCAWLASQHRTFWRETSRSAKTSNAGWRLPTSPCLSARVQFAAATDLLLTAAAATSLRTGHLLVALSSSPRNAIVTGSGASTRFLTSSTVLSCKKPPLRLLTTTASRSHGTSLAGSALGRHPRRLSSRPP
uniref:Uncharacterized protein n=1 Tax=Leersia perrieri TaxID=77586 RepID=A0A0D9XS24_9ORYZ